MDLIKNEDYAADSCAISPTAFLFMYSNLIQLTSSTLHEKIKMSIGVLGLGNNTFSSVWDIFFLFQPH